MGAAANFNGNAAAVDAAVVDAGDGFRAPGQAVMDKLGEGVTESVQAILEVPAGFLDKMKKTPGNIKNMPITNGANIQDIFKSLNKGEMSELGKVLLDFTGVNIRRDLPVNQVEGLLGLLKSPKLAKEVITKKLLGFLDFLKQAFIKELKKCIQKHLQALRNKHKWLDILLDLEGYIRRVIGNLRLKIQRRIRSIINKEILSRLQILDLTWLRQKMLSMIRKLCPGTRKSTVSPAMTRRYQTDPSWKVHDGTTRVSDTGSTAYVIDQGSDDFVNLIVQESVNQGQGYSNVGADSFVNPDGSVDFTYVNSDDTVIDSSDISSRVECT